MLSPQGLSAEGTQIGWHPSSVPHQPHGRQSQPRYGQKKVEGKVAYHRTEQRVINAVREMRANGLTLRAIASCLGEMKIPTKCRGKKWHPEMVKRILEQMFAAISLIQGRAKSNR